MTTNANGDSCDIYGNIYLGPLFIDPLVEDFHLSDWSPCIGAGQAGGPDEDVEGNPRPNPPGSLPDIGAYENALAAPVPYQGLSGALSGVLGLGTYRIAGTVSVNAGTTLRLLPGTTFLFGGPYPFEIRGTLFAEGTVSDSILFTSDGPLPEPWRGLRFSGTGSSGTFSYCVFEYGYAAGGDSADHGGAAYCDQASPSFAHCTFRHNSATALGGAVYCERASPPFMNCTFQANGAYGGGAVYCCVSSSPNFANCAFIGNDAWGDDGCGAGLACNGSSPRLADCLFTDNHAGFAGGGIYCLYSAAPTFTDCVLDNNISDEGGAVCCLMSSSPIFTTCTFSGNWAYNGGAVYCSGSSLPIFITCSFSTNQGHYDGGALYCIGASARLTYCTLGGNSAGEGGALYCRGSSPTFTNCSLSGNIATQNGAGVYCLNSSSRFKATVIAFSEGNGIYFQNSAASRMTYCDFFGNSGGNFTFYNDDSTQGPSHIGQLDTINANDDSCDAYRNIFLDPEFISSDDFHLQANSPCIDAGDPSLPFDPDTTVADIGAFYFDQSDVIIRPNLAPMTYALYQNYPNPFNSTTQIRFDIPQAAKVELKVYNILGQEVATLANDMFPAGTHRVSWDAASLPSGIYIYQLKAGSFREAKKMVLIR
ncbi:MAG: right-handed parallel beta-helix repeat-containing protein [bacterium]